MSADGLERLVIFGATGDLAGRYLLPALAELRAAGALPAGLEVTGSAREDLDDHRFRQRAAARRDRHAGHVPVEARQAVVESLRYRSVDLADQASVAAVVGDDRRPVAAYLALPPSTFATAVTTLGAAGLPAGSRIVLEKPFGEDLHDAVALNELVARRVGEDAVFRVDHVLGMSTLHNLLGARLANRVLEPLWNSTHVERVDIVWDETLALEGRAGYYDRAGALKDVIQNHLLQILCLVAMEPPSELTAAGLHAPKVELLRAVRVPTADEAARHSTRGRYTAGAGLPAYVDEEGVDPARGTETFAELVVEIDNDRWSGTPFLLRTGKALPRDRKGVVVRFRPAPPLPAGLGTTAPPTNELRIGLDGPVGFGLHLSGSSPGPPPRLTPLVLDADLPSDELPAYGHVLLDILSGDDRLSIGGEEAELAWRIVTPFLDAWAQGRVPLQDYPAGSGGPVRQLETDDDAGSTGSTV